VQEVLYSLVIERPEKAPRSATPGFTREDIDRAISGVNGKAGRRFGFNAVDGRNGGKVDLLGGDKLR
ncbi:MAG: hypothetical protein HY671_09315, partial [Chloroflexi bacterium]|nr:hypothetical protein [Chloroflexota bacterium]